MRIGWVLILFSSAFRAAAEAPADTKIFGDAEISAPALGSRIIIRTTNRLAGAIHSLTWNGQEFINSWDHGRQLQSALNLDLSTPITNETYNPTEAGSRRDGTGPTSSSVLLLLKAEDNRLQTRTQMAFWLNPGEKSGGQPAKNTTVLSNHIVKKDVTIGYKEIPNVIDYTTTLTIPDGEKHTSAVIESVTGYMPPEFCVFYAFDKEKGEAARIPTEPIGEQSKPLILATEDGDFAMGIYSPEQPSNGFETIGYGHFFFKAEKVSKWNCVFRINESSGIKPGDYTYHNYIPVGTLKDVTEALRKLCSPH